MKSKKRWKYYQADSPKRGYNKTVAELSEPEAKDELCDAMDCINELMAIQVDLRRIGVKYNYLPS